MQLLERDAHLATLDAHLADVRTSGRGQLVLLAGEAGVGKTALVRALRGAPRDRSPRLAGACEALFTPRPLGPLLDIAGDVGGELAAADRARRVGRRGARGSAARRCRGADDRRPRGPALGRRGDARPRCACSAGASASMPALLIATYRDDELERDHPLRVALGDLHAARSGSPSRRCRATPSRTRGTARHRRHRASMRGRAATRSSSPRFSRAAASTPGTVRDAVLARAARLHPPARRLLDAVAVARPRAEIWLLEQIAADDLPELEACLASGMLRAEGDAVAFRHEIARADDRGRASARPARRAAPGRARPRSSAAASPRGSRTTPRRPATPPPSCEYAEAAGDRAASARRPPRGRRALRRGAAARGRAAPSGAGSAARTAGARVLPQPA